MELTLPLLVAGIALADDAHDAAAADHLAVLADGPDAAPDLHSPAPRLDIGIRFL
jgi:hypothetical protein